MNNMLPDIHRVDSINPTLQAEAEIFELSFYQTKETLSDVESYRSFLRSAINRFRSSRTYKNYKAFLCDLGLNRCQLHGNLSSEMVTIEMHHNILTIFDIALLLTEHILATKGYITTFDLVEELKFVHTDHQVPLVMLSLTAHQMYHNEPLFNIDPNMCIGRWDILLNNYCYGITQDLGIKINTYFNQSKNTDHEYLDIRDNILSWGGDYNVKQLR